MLFKVLWLLNNSLSDSFSLNKYLHGDYYNISYITDLVAILGKSFGIISNRNLICLVVHFFI